MYRWMSMWYNMYVYMSGNSDAKSGGVFGGFFVFCPPIFRVENSR